MPSGERPSKFRLGLIAAGVGVLVSFSGCAKVASGPERRVENGVEVVINGDRPYPVEGKLATLTVKEEFRIDLEDPKYAEMGLSDVSKADLDSQGRVILFRQFAGEGPLVFVFDEHGKFLRSFGRRGQGPGEIVYPSPVGVTGSDEIALRDTSSKILFFDAAGKMTRTLQIRTTLRILGNEGISLLSNGSYLVQYLLVGNGGEAKGMAVGIFDSQFRKVKDLGMLSPPGSLAQIDDPFGPVPIFCASAASIFLGYEKRGSDIAVFDLEGNLRRLIRKSFRSVPLRNAFHDELLIWLKANRVPSGHLKFPAVYPDFQILLSDEQGRLYAVTYERDPGSNLNWCEIFSSDGVFIQRLPLGNYDFLKRMFNEHPGDMVIRNGRVLSVRDKENGYREVIVSSMLWH